MDIAILLRCSKYRLLNKTCNIRRTSERSAVDLAHDIYGPKPSESQNHIIVLHGLLGSKRNWKSLCKRLASTTKACVISADARNHGDSPHDNSHSYLDLAADISQLQQTLSLQHTHIIGHSMGGRTGMALALNEPSKVQSLIVVDISPILRKPNTVELYPGPKLLRIMKSVNFQGIDSGLKAKDLARRTMEDGGISKNGLDFLLMNIDERPDKSFGWKYNLDALLADFGKIASFPKELYGKQYPGSTLFVGGGKSAFIRISDEAAIKEYFPKATIKFIDHVGHNVHAEDPTTFFKIILDFYSKNL